MHFQIDSPELVTRSSLAVGSRVVCVAAQECAGIPTCQRQTRKNAGATADNDSSERRAATRLVWAHVSVPIAPHATVIRLRNRSNRPSLSLHAGLNKYRRERKEEKNKTAPSRNYKKTANLPGRSAVAVTTGIVTDTNIGKWLGSLRSAGITCVETGRTS